MLRITAVLRERAVRVRHLPVKRRLAGVPERRFEETTVEPVREDAEAGPLSCGSGLARLHAAAHRQTEAVRLDQPGEFAPRPVVRRLVTASAAGRFGPLPRSNYTL